MKTYIFKDHKEFRPNLSPEEIIKLGSFGGTYFREIKSRITNKQYKTRYNKYFSTEFLKKYEPKKYLCRKFSEYDKSLNNYKVKCGQKLEDWEDKGWITKHDPYGWFEWYCNFFKGRRIKDEDERQIKRWLNFAGPNGRFRKRLINEIKKQKKEYNDRTVSPVIRQSMQHWGYVLTRQDLSNN